MQSAPPRRPRRWSSACTGALVRLVLALMLAAMVAMPERELTLVAISKRKKVSRVVNGQIRDAVDDGTVIGQALFCVVGVEGLAATPYARRSRVTTVQVGDHPSFELTLYRDAGPHLVLDGLREWLTR